MSPSFPSQPVHDFPFHLVYFPVTALLQRGRELASPGGGGTWAKRGTWVPFSPSRDPGRVAKTPK